MAMPCTPKLFVFAAAIGGAVFTPNTAMELARSITTPESLWQLTLHHGLLDPALQTSFLPLALAEELLLRSPLTAVLHLPPKGGDDAALSLCGAPGIHAEGRRLLVRRFADPGLGAGLLSWRGRVIGHYAPERPPSPLCPGYL